MRVMFCFARRNEKTALAGGSFGTTQSVGRISDANNWRGASRNIIRILRAEQ